MKTISLILLTFILSAQVISQGCDSNCAICNDDHTCKVCLLTHITEDGNCTGGDTYPSDDEVTANGYKSGYCYTTIWKDGESKCYSCYSVGMSSVGFSDGACGTGTATSCKQAGDGVCYLCTISGADSFVNIVDAKKGTQSCIYGLYEYLNVIDNCVSHIFDPNDESDGSSSYRINSLCMRCKADYTLIDNECVDNTTLGNELIGCAVVENSFCVECGFWWDGNNAVLSIGTLGDISKQVCTGYTGKIELPAAEESPVPDNNPNAECSLDAIAKSSMSGFYSNTPKLLLFSLIYLNIYIV